MVYVFQHLRSIEIKDTDTVVPERPLKFVLVRADGSNSAFKVCATHSTVLYCTHLVRWNLSNPDTNGAEETVVVSEVSSFQRLK